MSSVDCVLFQLSTRVKNVPSAGLPLVRHQSDRFGGGDKSPILVHRRRIDAEPRFRVFGGEIFPERREDIRDVVNSVPGGKKLVEYRVHGGGWYDRWYSREIILERLLRAVTHYTLFYIIFQRIPRALFSIYSQRMKCITGYSTGIIWGRTQRTMSDTLASMYTQYCLRYPPLFDLPL